MVKLRRLTVLALLPLLSACGHMVHGNSQNIEVVAAGLPAGTSAFCRLANERSAWQVPMAPATVSVERSMTDLSVDCRTADGWIGRTVVKSTPSPYSFAGNIASGLAAGALIGPTSGIAASSTAAANSSIMGFSAASAGATTAVTTVGAGVAVGAAGAVVDLHSGAAWNYPTRITVAMAPTPYALTPITAAQGYRITPEAQPVRAPARRAPVRARRHASGNPTK